MTVACTRCQRRYAGGSYRDQYCAACGALVQPVSVRPCPRCDLPLQARAVADLVLDECGRCRGVFVDRTAVDLVLADERHARAQALLDALPPADHHPASPPGGRMYIKCPTCSVMMNRTLFAAGSGVVVDVCKAHGTFFDGGELPSIIEFVQAGGLARAAVKSAQEKRDRERRERGARQSASAMSSGNVSDGGTALVDFLFSLFR